MMLGQIEKTVGGLATAAVRGLPVHVQPLVDRDAGLGEHRAVALKTEVGGERPGGVLGRVDVGDARVTGGDEFPRRRRPALAIVGDDAGKADDAIRRPAVEQHGTRGQADVGRDDPMPHRGVDQRVHLLRGERTDGGLLDLRVRTGVDEEDEVLVGPGDVLSAGEHAPREGCRRNLVGDQTHRLRALPAKPARKCAGRVSDRGGRRTHAVAGLLGDTRLDIVEHERDRRDRHSGRRRHIGDAHPSHVITSS